MFMFHCAIFMSGLIIDLSFEAPPSYFTATLQKLGAWWGREARDMLPDDACDSFSHIHA